MGFLIGTGIKAMLKRTPGVISAEVSFEWREADVEYDQERTTREKIIEAITKLGYKATIKG
jgi:P-type Cu+ transporter